MSGRNRDLSRVEQAWYCLCLAVQVVKALELFVLCNRIMIQKDDQNFEP